MSDKTTTDIHEENLLPSVLMLVAGTKRIISVDYFNMDIRYQWDGEYKNCSSFFNAFLEQAKSYDICAFMNEDSDFVCHDALKTIVDTLWTRSVFGGAYCNALVSNIDDEILFYQLYPSYSANIFINRFVMNGPLFIKTSILSSFDEEITKLYTWDKFVDYCRMTMMCHIPEVLIEMNHNDSNDTEISKEYQIVNAKLQKK